jgi:hypothetical protein
MHPLLAKPRSVARKFYVDTLLDTHATWRYGLNAKATAEYFQDRPELGDEAKRVLSDLNENGVARSTLDALTGSSELFESLKAEAAALEQAQADALQRQAEELAKAESLGSGYEKSYVFTLLDKDRPVVTPDGVFARLMLHEQMKGIADSYYGMKTFVRDVNVWRNLPSKHAPVASQRWHRDQPEDHLILKTFVYLEDVTEGAGPLSYVKKTHGKGKRNWQPPVTFDGHNWRADDNEMFAVTDDSERDTFVGPAGTVLFADTFGWHKGGQATTKSRFVLQGLWASRSALPDRLLGVPEGLDIKSAPKALAYDRRLSNR